MAICCVVTVHLTLRAVGENGLADMGRRVRKAKKERETKSDNEQCVNKD